MTQKESTAVTTRDSSALAEFKSLLDSLPGLDDDPTPRMMNVILNCASPA